jgi:tetratricopeptide (TPR) repeat protein
MEKQQLEEILKRCDAEIRRTPALAAPYVQRGIVLQSLQRPVEALQSFERAIRFDPDFADAHYLRANLLAALRKFDEAVAGYDSATRTKPDFAQAWNNRARALRALRRLDEALQSCERAITLAPEDADAYVNRGNILTELGRPEDAFASYGRAIDLAPDLVEARFNRANAALRLGRAEDALPDFDQAIILRPGFAEAHHGRANALERLGRLMEAVQGFNRAAALKPDFAESYNNKGNALRRLGRQPEAIDSYTQAVRIRPGYALAWSNRASALKDAGQLEDALESCDRAIALAPGFAAAHHNKGNVLKSLKRMTESIQSFDRTIELSPGFEDAHRNRATTTLLMGDFERGWQLYERRIASIPVLTDLGSSWTGDEDLAGKTLLIVAEQGLGDTFQFCRYAPLAAARGAHVTLAAQDPLVALLKCLEPGLSVTALGMAPPCSDYHIPLLSMPCAFRTRADNIPSAVPYLRADPEKIQQWKARIGTNGFKVGISWQGAVGGDVDIGRSFPVRYFETLADIPGMRLISLQKNAGAEQLRDLPPGMEVETFGDALDPRPDAFVDTAAIMENLDLVISSDTAVAHLAGALGRPIWAALSHVPDWRWLMDRDDSPWYPTMRLFRQTARNDWTGAFTAMKMSLLELLSTRRTNS